MALVAHLEEGRVMEPWVPRILIIGKRGVRVKIWTFLYVNRPHWFTAQQIAKFLSMPLSTAQAALKDVRVLGPGLECEDKERSGKGRPEKKYGFQGIPRM